MAEPTGERRDFLKRLVQAMPALSLLIASLSLIASISQSYNYRKNIESVQQNVLRAESLKTCRDIIEVFFAFRHKAEDANARGATDEAMAREMRALVYRFGAFGTYLANFSPEIARERYSKLSWLLNDIALKAAGLPKGEFDAKFTEADGLFGTLNEDCVKNAHFVKI